MTRENKYHQQQNVGNEEAFIGNAIDNSLSSSEVWLVDSGASEHMTHHREWFRSFTESNALKQVRIGDGTLLQVEGESEIDILMFSELGWQKRFLKKVLYVPKIKVNLFSTAAVLEKGFDFKCTKKQLRVYT